MSTCPKAVLFDLDGVLWHSSDAHARAFVEAFAEQGIAIPLAAYDEIAGMRTDAAVARLAGLFAPHLAHDAAQLAVITARKRAMAIRLLESEVAPDFAVAGTVSRLRGAGYQVALATSASRATMSCFLNQLPASCPFDATICGEDVAHGKPEPDIFLAAARAAGAAAADCIVVEDSEAGVVAASRAGMRVVAYRLDCWSGIQQVIARSDTLAQVADVLIALRMHAEAAT